MFQSKFTKTLCSCMLQMSVSVTSRDNVSQHLKSPDNHGSNDLHEQPSRTRCVQLTKDTPSPRYIQFGDAAVSA